MQEFKENNNDTIHKVSLIEENKKFNESFDESLRKSGYDIHRTDDKNFKISDDVPMNLDNRYIYTKKYNIDWNHPEAIRIGKELEQFPINIQTCFYGNIHNAILKYDEQVKNIDKLNELSNTMGNNRKKNKKLRKLAEKLNVTCK